MATHVEYSTAINILFHERVKTAIIALTTLSIKYPESCSFGDLYEKTPLKRWGVGRSTLSSVLKNWIKEGIVNKVKAPFPYRHKYVLAEGKGLAAVGWLDEWIQFKAESDRVAIGQNKPDHSVLLGSQLVKEWDFACKTTLLQLVEERELNYSWMVVMGFHLVQLMYLIATQFSPVAKGEIGKELREYVEAHREEVRGHHDIFEGEFRKREFPFIDLSLKESKEPANVSAKAIKAM